MRGPKSLDSQEFSRLNVLNSCESSCRGGTLNDENVIIRYTTLFAWIWLIFGAIQRRYPNAPSPNRNVPSPSAPLPGERGGSNGFLRSRGRSIARVPVLLLSDGRGPFTRLEFPGGEPMDQVFRTLHLLL